MPLTNKFLRYSPEITLEIFTLVWDKLIKNGWREEDSHSISRSFSEFSNDCGILKDRGDKKFNTNTTIKGVETTVQEILGYDPFIKKEVIPECIEPNKDGVLKYTTLSGISWSGGTIQNHLEAIIPTTGNCYNKKFSTSYIPVKLKMLLSVNDEELPTEKSRGVSHVGE